MSYKNRMHPTVSNAEMEVLRALSNTGLTEGLITQRTIVLKSTVPDFCWPQKRKVVYLDGSQVHKKSKQEARDQEIDDLLVAQGWEVLRIPYEAPLSKKNLDSVMTMIKEFLGAE
jgi:very-short-patch-repair endonuclease